MRPPGASPSVQTYMYAWDEPQGTGACTDGGDRADAAVLSFRICNAFVHGRIVIRHIVARRVGRWGYMEYAKENVVLNEACVTNAARNARNGYKGACTIEYAIAQFVWRCCCTTAFAPRVTLVTPAGAAAVPGPACAFLILFAALFPWCL